VAPAPAKLSRRTRLDVGMRCQMTRCISVRSVSGLRGGDRADVCGAGKAAYAAARADQDRARRVDGRVTFQPRDIQMKTILPPPAALNAAVHSACCRMVLTRCGSPRSSAIKAAQERLLSQARLAKPRDLLMITIIAGGHNGSLGPTTPSPFPFRGRPGRTCLCHRGYERFSSLRFGWDLFLRPRGDDIYPSRR
jgi:hypothetical protein